MTRMGLWIVAALLTGVAGVRMATAPAYDDARLISPHVIKPASLRGL